MEVRHQPVLLNEAIKYLDLKKNQNVIDCTLGGGGHAKEILKKTAPNGKLIAIDLDPQAIKRGRQVLEKYLSRIIFIEDNYKNINKIKKNVFANVQTDAVLCDLGLSSDQLEDNGRGFSFGATESLDLRFGPSVGTLTAEKIVNKYSEKDLIKIFREHAQETLARQIAQKIIAKRRESKIKTPLELAHIIKEVYQSNFKTESRRNPATKVFQALRIEVNSELISLKAFLPLALESLKAGGRLVIISFHSLEERLIKEFIRRELRDCICPPKAPACVCNHRATIKKLIGKPIKPSAKEIADNPRSRSAKLWAIIKI